MVKTELRNQNTMHIDKMSPEEMVKVMQQENLNGVLALNGVLDEIAEVIEKASVHMADGGRLLYVGCGTSGRLGVLDAAECPPTFGVPYELVEGIIAGGDTAIRKASEGAEDSYDAGVKSVSQTNLSSKDTVVGISASGGAAFVIGAMEVAKKQGAFTVAITSNSDSPIAKIADVAIAPDTGAEVVTGSTRLKAGTAQKMILGMISTGVMIRLGNVYENLMINLKPSNIKLKRRMIGIVSQITGCHPDKSEELLEKSDWNICKAIEINTETEKKKC